MSRRLNQVIAVEKDVKSKGNTMKSELYKIAQKSALFNGIIKRYEPIREDGEKFPDEKQKVQFEADRLVQTIASTVRDLFNVEATKDYANCNAKADIVVDGEVLVAGAPTTFLLYLEKELTDLATFADTLPVLSEDEDWKRGEDGRLFRTEPSRTARTKKVQKPIVLYPPTVEHPAQTQLITEDETIGWWNTTKLSGAMTSDEKKALQARIQKLSHAVKSAREQANMVVAEEQDAGTKVVAWLMGYAKP